MHEDDTQVLAPPSGGNGSPPLAAARSALDVFRERRDRLASDRYLDLEVPGAQGLLSLRLGAIPGTKQAQLAERVQKSKSPERDFNLNADTLIAACQAVLGRDDRRDPFEPLTDEDGDLVRLDTRLAERLRLPPRATARDVVRYLFGFAPSPELAVGRAAFDYMEWATATNLDLGEELLGEA